MITKNIYFVIRKTLIADINSNWLIIYYLIQSSILKSTCDVNLLSKLSIIFKEWRVVNNMYRGGARV
jgi:hypothetical protein